MDLAYIPSPSRGVLNLGPIPLRAYAFCIIIGVVVAVWLGSKRWVARGGGRHTVGDIAVWAVPFGLIGGRLYHVITDNQLYFREGRHPLDALKIWEGGLGIWGAIAFGAVGAWIGARRRGVPLPAYADAIAPGIVLAQACGRWGNWFNQELYGRPTTLPWGLKIDKTLPDGTVIQGVYHPTFLYESIWCVLVAILVIWADKRYHLGHGRVFALYVAAYTFGRFWTEWLRIDEAHRFFGLRLNDWVAVAVFVGAIVAFLLSAKYRPGREDPDSIDPQATKERAEAAEAAAGQGAEDAPAGTPEDPAAGSAAADTPPAAPSGTPADGAEQPRDASAKLSKDSDSPS